MSLPKTPSGREAVVFPVSCGAPTVRMTVLLEALMGVRWPLRLFAQIASPFVSQSLSRLARSSCPTVAMMKATEIGRGHDLAVLRRLDGSRNRRIAI